MDEIELSSVMYGSCCGWYLLYIVHNIFTYHPFDIMHCTTPQHVDIIGHKHHPPTVPGRQGRQKIIPPKNAEYINKFIKYFVEINKNEVNKNYRQKTKEKM